MTEIRPATMEGLTRFYGKRPTRSLCAMMAVRNGQILGVAGYYNDSSRFVLFADFGDEVRHDKRLIVRGLRAMTNLLKARRVPVKVLADPDIPGSEKLLEHMGCTPLGGRIYQWAP